MPLLDVKFNMMATCAGVAKQWQNYPVRCGLIGSSGVFDPSVSD